MNKKIVMIISVILIILLSILIIFLVFKRNRYQEVNVYLFSGETCPVCKKARTYLQELDQKFDNKINLIELEVWYNEENRTNMDKVSQALGDTLSGVPYIIVGEESFVGFSDTISEKLEVAIETEMKKENPQDIVAPIIEKK